MELSANATENSTASHEALLKDIVRRLVAVADPENLERIVLFGSRARGDHHPDSDIDLVVVENRPFANSDEQWEAIWRYRNALKGIGIARDILVVDRDKVRASEAFPERILTLILRDGRTLYARP